MKTYSHFNPDDYDTLLANNIEKHPIKWRMTMPVALLALYVGSKVINAYFDAIESSKSFYSRIFRKSKGLEDKI